MTNIFRDLSPEQKRALLVKLLDQKGSDIPRIYPLSYGQHALWFMHQLAAESGAYNEPLILRMRSELNVPALQHALQTLIDRHPVLRTVYVLQDSKPVQKVLDGQMMHFTSIDATTWSQDRLNDYLAAEVYRPIDLEHGPVFRVQLLTRGPSEHVLMLVTHHIAIDGWSRMVLLDELGKLYQAYKNGQPAALPEPEVQYWDYVRWQIDMLSTHVGEELWAYWQKQLSGPLPMLQLPTDRPRPAIQTYSGAAHAFTLNKQLSQQLKALANSEGVTLYVLLLAAFQILLYRYSGQEDILVYSPANGRTKAAFDGIIGYFVNPVILRARLEGNPSFRTFLSQAQRTVIEALEHQEYPFPLLVGRLPLQRDPSRSPLCDVAFIMQQLNRYTFSIDPTAQESSGVYGKGTTGAHLDLEGLVVELVNVEQCRTKFDLELEIVAAGETLSGSLQYNIDLFDTHTMIDFANHFQTLLQSIIAEPDQCIANLPLLTRDERQRMLGEWNETAAEYPKDACLHELVEAQVERTPEAVAVAFENAHLSYRELNRRANQLAHYLRRLGVGPEVLVGVCLERSVEMVVGLLAILKAGGAYVPLEPSYPRERLAYMLEDAQVGVLLTQERLSASLPVPHGVRLICLDTQREEIGRESEEAAVSGVTCDNLAYVIYTSGSTGRPKGVLVAHRGLGNLAEAQVRTFDLRSSDRILQFSSLSFDASIFEIIMALRIGAMLCLGTREALLPGPRLTQLLRDLAITHVTLPPSVLASLPVADLPALRTIIVAGEACPAELVVRWAGGRRFFNAYGPTEASVWTTVAQCVSGKGKPTIGRPIANVQVYLLDRHLQPVPDGVPGELHIGGIGLARGYLKRPELTAEKFIPHPFSDDVGARLYKTGDLARYQPDGTIEFLGRIDHQVKVRGLRIELGEIEACLTRHAAIRECAVLVDESVPDNKRLVAYLVTASQPPPSASELRNILQEQLPDYMLPTAFIFVDSLPLNSNGKLDRQALPAPHQLQPQLRYVAPQTEVEQTIAQIWQTVLRLDQVGVEDNFFELGGNSLLMGEVLHLLCQAFQHNISLITLFRYATIKSLADFIGDAHQQPRASQEGYARASSRKAHLRRRQQLGSEF